MIPEAECPRLARGQDLIQGKIKPFFQVFFSSAFFPIKLERRDASVAQQVVRAACCTFLSIPTISINL